MENAAGTAGLEEAVKDMSVGALAYDTVPLSSAGKLDMFSPEFQSLVTDKGAMILHMLRWVMGDQKFDQTMRDFATKYAGKSASLDDFHSRRREELRRQADLVLLPVAGFHRRAGIQDQVHGLSPGQATKASASSAQIAQDLDLFRMPVDLRIDTDGKTEEQAHRSRRHQFAVHASKPSASRAASRLIPITAC